MKISELARSAGLPLATVKYYLREGLVQPGRATAATQADYDARHVTRLSLIRALVDVAGLSLANVRTVLSLIDAGPESLPWAIGAAHGAIGRTPDDDGAPPALAQALIKQLGWSVATGSPAARQLEAALTAAEAVGLPTDPERLQAYGDAALTAATVDIGGLPTTSAEEAVRYVVLGTVLYEPILLALRRLAQQHLYAGATSATRSGTKSEGPPPPNSGN